MNVDIHSQFEEGDEPLTRADIDRLLRDAEKARYLNLSGRKLDRVDLANFNLSGVNLSGASLRGANLNAVDLSFANLSGANLSGAFLINAYLQGANFSEATLSEANLYNAFLLDADLRGANLSGADFSETDLSNANLNGANLNETIGLEEAMAVAEKRTPAFRFRITEEPLTPHNLALIISAITELSTKCWLIVGGRFADLIEYTQTKDVRFVEEAQLTIPKIRHDSPLDASFNIDLRLSPSNLAEAIRTTIDGVTQIKQRLEKAELENEAKAQDIKYAKQKADHEDKTALLEQERQALVIERERLEILERRLEVQKKGIEYALEVATKTVAVLHPSVDEQTKAMLIQTLLPSILQLHNGKGLELVLPPSLGPGSPAPNSLFLPPPQSSGDEATEPENG